MTSDAVGERVAAYRRRRGLSQAALAGLVGRSESWLSQVERGVRAVDRLSVLVDMARVLQVRVEALTGAPGQYARNGDGVPGQLDGIQRFFARYDHLLGAAPVAETTLADLRTRTAAAHGAYQAARYEEVIGQLPGLLTAAETLRQSARAEHRGVLLTYVSAYVVAAKLLTRLGVGDLALVASDRAASAAATTRSPVAQGMAAYQVVCALLRMNRPDGAEPLAVAMAEQLRSRAGQADPESLSVAGATWLIAAVIAARRRDRAEAGRRLDVAAGLAATLGLDRNLGWTAFGPTNVAIHRGTAGGESARDRCCSPEHWLVGRCSGDQSRAAVAEDPGDHRGDRLGPAQRVPIAWRAEARTARGRGRGVPGDVQHRQQGGVRACRQLRDGRGVRGHRGWHTLGCVSDDQ